LKELEALGIDKIILSSTRAGAGKDSEEARALIEAEVLPQYRA
jgi:hypothetical protein